MHLSIDQLTSIYINSYIYMNITGHPSKFGYIEVFFLYIHQLCNSVVGMARKVFVWKRGGPAAQKRLPAPILRLPM